MIVEFRSSTDKQSSIVFCVVDQTRHCATAWIREVVKNQADYTLHNITGKQYDVYQGFDEDKLLRHVTELGYKYAVVVSTGTEFINGRDFFDSVEKLCQTDFFIAGHILDRNDAYYELHSQCYIINLKYYNKYGRPNIGLQTLSSPHVQYAPMRSIDNLHDDYTPTHVVGGFKKKQYNHKCHGWHILSVAFDYDLPVVVFDDHIRNSKIHLYPEYNTDFNKNIQTIYQRESYCATDFVHTANTEWEMHIDRKFKQVLTPASGIWYKNFIEDDARIIFYDYNKKSLEYWKQQVPNASFVHLDLINGDFDITKLIDMSLVNDTIINLSNIFCYEGTCHFYSSDYKIHRENLVLQNIKDNAPTASLYYSNRAAGVFDTTETLHGELTTGASVKLTKVQDLKLPTWRLTDIQ